MRGFSALALFLCLHAAAAADDSLVSIGDQKYLAGSLPPGKITYIKYPTLGCPAIIKAGSTGAVWVKLGDGGSTSTFLLTLQPTVDPASVSYTLTVIGATFDATTGIYEVGYQVPSGVPEETYDLHLGVPALSLADVQYNSFRVVTQEPSSYPFIVISDTHFNDPQGWWSPANSNPVGYNAYTIIQQMKREIRALRPAFVIMTGDATFGLDYDYEFEGLWKTWKDTGVPIFMVPGNHDAYSCIEDRWFLGIHSPVRDGLDYWRRYMGPCFYSFQFGGLHFQAVNSADGTPERRDGFLIVIENYGGDLTPEQMDWISADLAGTASTVVPYMHHTPLGGYRPNQPFGMTQWVINRILEWITTGNFDSFGQNWNTQATAEFLLAKYAAVPVVFIGHNHHDEIKTYGTTTYKYVTSGGSSSGTYWGYAYVTVQDSQIVDYLYLDEEHQSIPTGNLHVARIDAEGPEQKTKIESGLAKSFDITVEFTMPAAGAYAATNGEVIQTAPLASGLTRVWVKTQSPVAASQAEPQNVEVTVTATDPAVAGSVEGSGNTGSGSGACGMVGLEALLGLGLVALLRRRKNGRAS